MSTPEPSDPIEIEELYLALKVMTAEINKQIMTIIHQKEEQEIVFSSMMEGLLIIGRDKKIINMNKSFSLLLNINPLKAGGAAVLEIIKVDLVIEFIEDVFVSDIPIEKDIEMPTLRKIFHVYGKSFLKDKNSDTGALIVLNDYTRLKHLERQRKEFVANVSHELKTPITSIKGFVETLTHKAASKEETDKFLNIILRQSDRLNSIIDDLLSLSELERYSETSGLQLESSSVKNVLMGAVNICRERAANMKIELFVECDELLYGLLNSHLLEQAVANLIDNAIKYSQGTSVTISAQKKDTWQTETIKVNKYIIIKVKDNGIGIDAVHLNRIFERFYRIDKGRSRHMGGTGLGLSIVKHIAEVHGGAAKVESEAGLGSIFSITIRAAD